MTGSLHFYPIRVAFALVILSGVWASGQIPQNGSFESNYTFWSASGNQGIATNDPSHPASNGSKVVVFNQNDTFPNAVLSQSFTTTPNQRYDLAFDLGTVGRIADQKIEVTITGTNGLISDQIVTVSGPDAGPFYTPQHISFTANGASTTVTFQDVCVTYYVIDMLLDFVQATPINSNVPNIVSPPQKTSAPVGGTANFSVNASGPGPLSYQWRFNGANIGGATSSSYTINNVQNANAGNYDVIVSNASGSFTSSAATLTVLPPAILLNGGFEYGSAAWTFTGVAATSTNANYGVSEGSQLAHFNFAQSVPNGTISQSFSTVIGQSYVLSFDYGVYSFQSTAEQRIQVTVQGQGSASSLIAQNFSVFGQGTGSHYISQSVPFVADKTTTVLTFQDTSPSTQNIDLLLDNVRVTLQDAPLITSQPQSVSVQAGSSANFSVTATGQPPLSYQWRFNGTDIPGASGSTYTINSVQNSDGGNYDVVVSNGSGSATSSTAVLTVLPAGILANGSFEFDYSAWSRTGNQNITSAPYPVTNGSKAVAFNAGQAAPNGVLIQNFSTTNGQTYVLNFDMGVLSYQSTGQERMQVTVSDQGTGNIIITQSFSLFGQGTGSFYTPQSLIFTAVGAMTTLTFQDTSLATQNIDLLLDNVRVTGQDAPIITSQPQSTSAPVGGVASFSVAATGQAPLGYQWRFNGGDIPGATSDSYIINNVQNGDGGNYDVVVSNGAGSVTSSTALLTVLPAGGIANGSFESDYSGWTVSGNQSIETAPYPSTDGSKLVAFNAGQRTPNGLLTQTFSTVNGQTYVVNFDQGLLSYQSNAEQRVQVTVKDGGQATIVTQSFSLFGQGTGTFYVAQSLIFTATSSTSTLIFQDTSPTTQNIDLLLDNVRVASQNAPAITSQPQSTSAQVGGTATFNVTASGQPPLSYQWRFNGGDIPGATTDSYIINNVQNGDAGNYDVVVSNGSGTIASAVAVLTVLPSGILANGSFEFDYSGWNTSGNQGITGAPYPVTDGAKAVAFNAGQRTPNGVLSQTFSTTNGQSYVVNFDMGLLSYQSSAEQRMQVTVQNSSNAAIIITQSFSLFGQGTGSFYAPRSIVFTAIGNTTTLTFQDTSPATQNIDLLLDNVRVALQDAPAITSQPQSTSTQAGGNVTFTVTATGQAPLSYQWRYNGGDIQGANADSYSINNVQNSDAGNYDVVVSNGSGSVTSNTAVLSVLPAGLPANGSFEFDYSAWTATGNQNITGAPYPVTDGSKAVAFNAGQATPNGILTQTFSTTNLRSYILNFDLGVLSYQSTAQERMQVTVRDQTTNNILFTQSFSLNGQGTGSYYAPQSVTFTATGGSTTLTFQDTSPATQNIDLLLDNVRIMVQEAPVITSQPQNATAQVGGMATFSVTATGQAPLSYQWRFNGGDIPGANSSSYTINNVQNADAGDYDVVVSNGGGPTPSSTATLTVLPAGILANGSFEFDYAAWTPTGNQNVDTSPYPVTDGSKMVVFNGGQATPNGVLTQTFSTTDGQSYIVNFDMGVSSFQSTAEQRMQVTVQNSSNATIVTQSFSVFGPGTGGSYTAQSISFTGSGNTTTLVFQDTSPATQNIDLLLDNVRVTQQGSRSPARVEVQSSSRFRHGVKPTPLKKPASRRH